MSKFDIDLDTTSHEDLKKAYTRLLSSRDGLKRRNDEIAKWTASVNECVTILATEGALVFQAMAEKAGVRSHPSVTQAVQLFDSVSHPQWRASYPEVPKIEWPTDWDFDDADAQSGDADMCLNAPIAEAISFIDAMRLHIPSRYLEATGGIIEGLDRALRDGVEGVKDAAGFKPIHVGPLPQKHYRDMESEQLSDLLSALGWMALDLAQDMHFANNMLRRDLRASCYRRVCAGLYRMSQLAIEPAGDAGFDVKVLGSEAPF